MVYSLAGASLHSYATEFRKIFAAQIASLSGLGAMGGNCGESKAWATNYDATVADAMIMTETLISAMGNYASVLQQLGYNYALADYEAGSGRPQPIEPTPLVPAWAACQVLPPAAGGPGSGLFDDVGFAVDALAKFGLEMPDGDPEKLQTAADAWAKFASTSGAANLPTMLDGLARSFEAETAPDLAQVDDDLRELKAATVVVLSLYGEISQACTNHRSAIVSFRDKMEQLLKDLAVDLAIEAGTTVIFMVVAGALTAGLGAAAIAGVKAGRLAIKLESYVDRAVGIIKAAKFISKITENAEEIQTKRVALKRLADLITNRKNHGDILSTGGRVGRVPKDDAERWYVWADKAYDYIRNDTLDVASIADKNGLSVTDVEKIKQHVFNAEHKIVDPYTGEVRVGRFDSDPDMAEAWLRLSEGRGTATDRLLLDHELTELRYLEANPGATYNDAHVVANQAANWESAVGRK
ncbi:hypothetical protein ACFV24_01550 [Nocardia fluminea]|uniref:hypothetical protein n=1 Tax=Nocardia fluminea TaxID=134984 RepID=UPI00366BBE2A